MATTIAYELKTCGRCGGSGRFSFNAIHGDRCYGCSGSGKVFSAAGKKAHAAVQAFKVENFSIAVEALEPGMQVVDHLGRYTVTTGAHCDLNGSKYGKGKNDDGSTIWVPYVMVDFKSGGRGFCAGHKVTLRPVGEQFERLLAFARTIKRGVIITEQKTEQAA